jgi:hypothetical protein
MVADAVSRCGRTRWRRPPGPAAHRRWAPAGRAGRPASRAGRRRNGAAGPAIQTGCRERAGQAGAATKSPSTTPRARRICTSRSTSRTWPPQTPTELVAFDTATTSTPVYTSTTETFPAADAMVSMGKYAYSAGVCPNGNTTFSGLTITYTLPAAWHRWLPAGSGRVVSRWPRLRISSESGICWRKSVKHWDSIVLRATPDLFRP